MVTEMSYSVRKSTQLANGVITVAPVEYSSIINLIFRLINESFENNEFFLKGWSVKQAVC